MEAVKLPTGNVGDLVGGLRRLADEIESGEHGEVFVLAWVMPSQKEAAMVEAGLLGQTADPVAMAHLLFSHGMRSMELMKL